MALMEDVAAALGGDAKALDTEPAKGEGKSPAEVVAGLSAKQRKALRARAEAIIEALDEAEAAEPEPEAEEEEA
jgi:hypothetical protein